MKKVFLIFLFCLISFFYSNIVLADDTSKTIVATMEELTNNQNEEIISFFKDYENLQNKHKLFSLKKFYSDEFVNADGFNKEQLFKLMEKTYNSYPDIKIVFDIENILFQNDYAMVVVNQVISATTKDISKITNDKGIYSGNLKNIFYLKKIGKVWKIYSEDVIFESSKLAYGVAKNIEGTIVAPQKVLGGADYCAGVKVEKAEGFSAIASINSTQIVDGYNLDGEVFRQISSSENELERILKANTKNNNEAVVVSLGFTKINQDIFKKKKIDLEGLLLLMKRIDIISINDNWELTNEQNIK